MICRTGPPPKQPLWSLLSPRSASGVEGDVFVANIGPVQAPKQPPTVIVWKIKHKRSQKESKLPLPCHMSALPLRSRPLEFIQPLATQTIPGVSEWVMGIIKLGYSLQFARVVSTSVQSENAHVLRSELIILLEKGAIERVPPTQSESGFYSRYFLIPKKDGALRPILDLRHLNCALMMRSIQADHIKTYLLADSARGLVLFSGPERCIF